MTLDKIKKLIGEGKRLFVHNRGYEIIKDSNDKYLVKHIGGSCIGLYWIDDRNKVRFNVDAEAIFVA